VNVMTKRKKLSFAELVKENKRQLLRDLIKMEKIEKKVDEKYLSES
jgi:hypothetical protein